MKKNTLTSEVLYGIHPVLEMLRAKKRKVYAVYTTHKRPKMWPLIEKMLPSYTRVSITSREALTKMAGVAEHQNVVAHVAPFPVASRFFTPDSAPFIVLLDGIQDPHNMGAILRSAYCTGVDGAVICKKGSAPLSPTVFKASAGLAEHVRIYKASSVHEAVALLKDAGYTCYFSVPEGGIDATQQAYTFPLCVVIGNEGEGVTKSLVTSGKTLTLAQKRSGISYNASVAAGILLFLIGTKGHKIS